MPVFSLTDVQFNTPAQRTGVSQLTEDANKLNIFRYPIDLGSVDKGHYMVININEQINTSFVNSKSKSGTPTIKQNQDSLAQIGSTGSTLDQKIKSLTENVVEFIGADVVKKLGGQVGIQDITQNIEKFGLRTVQRISETIAFYMPDTIQYNHTQNYTNVAPGNEIFGQAAGVGASLAQSFQEGIGGGEIFKSLTPAAVKFLADKLAGDTSKILFTAGTGGLVSNPMIDIIYSSPQFRNFRFDFMLYPRSEQEAVEVYQIIDTLKFHQAPELANGVAGAFLYPPSEFDISFYYNGQVNPNIPPISTCVLNSIDIDYVPTGNFSTYEVPGQPASIGGTGTPVAIRLGLAFTETEYLVKGSPTLSNMVRRELKRPLAVQKMLDRDPNNIV